MRMTGEARKAALQRRLEDIARGANGGDGWCFDHRAFQRFMFGIVDAFLSSDTRAEQYRTITAHWNIDEFDTPARATDFLWRNGVRP